MNQVQNCVQIINQQIKNFKPDVGLILGSGLGQFCDNINPKASLNFEDLPGFPVAGVGGHAGKLLFGEIQGTNVVVMHCLLYTSPSPRDQRGSRMPSSA